VPVNSLFDHLEGGDAPGKPLLTTFLVSLREQAIAVLELLTRQIAQ